MNSVPKFSIISLFPDLITHASSFGVLGRAITNNSIQIEIFNPRDYTDDPRSTVDDSSYGGGPGMVMQVTPIRRAILAAKKSPIKVDEVIYLSPQGTRVGQKEIVEIGQNSHTVFLAGRYEGIDQRLIDSDITREVSLGDFVMSGGEFAALAILDAVSRSLPGVLGNQLSASEDSFHAGLLDHPHYTRPEEVDGQSVPPVLLSGDHEAIRRWRRKMSLGATYTKRPDLLTLSLLSSEDEMLLSEFRAEMQNKEAF
jgi:tRNA (guanine37-N1)-methyltransferase